MTQIHSLRLDQLLSLSSLKSTLFTTSTSLSLGTLSTYTPSYSCQLRTFATLTIYLSLTLAKLFVEKRITLASFSTNYYPLNLLQKFVLPILRGVHHLCLVNIDMNLMGFYSKLLTFVHKTPFDT